LFETIKTLEFGTIAVLSVLMVIKVKIQKGPVGKNQKQTPLEEVE
jgi:hypothetical protein